ncbi:hypothetical protein TNCV_1773611 [Trichonephila clavipes]|nr:hypothetical protein TNCV_1773611 [Trichonephila clavipes]
MVLTDAEARNVGAACVWMVDNETVGSMRAIRIMRRSPRLVVCRVRPEPGCPVRGLYLASRNIKHLLTKKSVASTKRRKLHTVELMTRTQSALRFIRELSKMQFTLKAKKWLCLDKE